MFRSYKLILGRHGESILNSQNRFSGWIDTPLNKKGILQSFYMGQKLLNNHLIPNIIFTSQLIRTIQTSNIIQHFLKKDIQTISSWNLNERHYGILQGKNRNEAIKEYGIENISAIRNDFYAMPYFFDNKYIYDTNHLINNEKESIIGESSNMVAKRFLPYFYNEIKYHFIENNILMIISHKHVLKTLIKELEEKNDEEYKEIKIPHDVLFYYEFNENFQLIRKKTL
jgi:2,3-bisphosphoglycerate-dependent phosphoglycerate mutase